MRIATAALAIGCAISLTGCSEVVSLNSFAGDGTASDSRVVGYWNTAKGDEPMLIRQGDSAYEICYKPGKESVTLRGRLIQAGDAALMDLVSAQEDPFQQQVHTIVRVWPEGMTLRWAILDTGWFREQVKKELAAVDADGRTLIVAPGEAVAQFLVKYAADSRAYEKQQVLYRAQ